MTRARRLGTALLLASLGTVLASAAGGVPTVARTVSFEETQIRGPLDFFEGWDGVLEDGDADEATLWTPVCGTFEDGDVTGGGLELSGPNAPCGGSILAANFGVPGPIVVRASFEWDIPELGETRSLILSNQGTTDQVAIAVNRDDLSSFGLTPDTTVVALAVEDESGIPTPVRFQPVSFNTASDPALVGVQAIELRLTLTDAGNGTLDPLAEFRLCMEKDPCESEAVRPFVAVTAPLPGAPLDREPLAADETHGPALAVLFPTAFTARVLDLSVESDGHGDDYEDESFEPANHVFFCGSAANVVEVDGALTLDRTGGACGSLEGVQLAPATTFPSPQTLETTLLFTAPEVCASYGVTLGSSSANFGQDTVSFSVTRYESDPDTLVLAGVSEPVDGGPLVPTFARTDVLLASIEDDALLQLRLALEPGLGDALTPTLSFRFCPALGCPDEGTLPFTTLAGAAVCDPAPPGEVCPDFAAADLCPAGDFGDVLSPEPIGATLFSVPEPGVAASAMGALAALIGLAARRRRTCV